ncbi:MAG: beta-lactamase family protein [Lachnospiraceae bacterium]|nr:beta-lactamase family protein [Lachnospiraceae bacterium]
MKYQNVQTEMQNMLDEVTQNGREKGIQLAVYLKGELVVNACSGVADTETKVPVTEETLFPSFSVTKGISATLLHILADRGMLDYEQKICEIWPDFAKCGKENITVRQALDHTAAVPHLPEKLTNAELNNWEYMCRLMEDTKPLWAAGELQEYHAITYSFTVGRIIELVSKKTIAELLKTEICEPLGVKMFIGIPEELIDTLPIAAIYEPGFDKNNLNGNGIITIPECCMSMSDWINKKETLKACLPGVGGVFNALSLARHYAALLPGGADGISLLSEARVKEAKTVSSTRVMPDGTSYFGLGYGVGGYNGRKSIFGHGGYGGSMTYADSLHDFAVGLTKNYIHAGSAEMEIIRAVMRKLNIPVDF